MSANSAAFDHVQAFRWRQGDPALAASEARLYDLAALRSELEEAVEIAVADARADGTTWSRIGDALGVTQQAAADPRRRTRTRSHRGPSPSSACAR